MVAGHHHHAYPGGLALGDGLRHVGANRILQPDQSEELEFEVVLQRRQNVRGKPRSGNTKDAQSFDRHRPNLMRHLAGSFRIEVAQIDNGLGRTLCGDEPLRLIGRLPDS